MKIMPISSAIVLAACSPAQPNESTIGREATEGATLTISPADPNCADFCIKVASAPVRPGDPVEGVISWTDAPANSVLGLSLDRADGNRQRIQNEKAEQSRNDPGMNQRFDGSLLTRSVPISGSGSIHFRWSGKGFACYRTEIPEICPGEAALGHHLISATVMDKTTIVHPFAHPDTVRQAKPRVVFERKSKPFYIG